MDGDSHPFVDGIIINPLKKQMAEITSQVMLNLTTVSRYFHYKSLNAQRNINDKFITHLSIRNKTNPRTLIDIDNTFFPLLI